MDEQGSSTDEKQEARKDTRKLAGYWQKQIKLAEKNQENFHKRGDKIVETYRGPKNDSDRVTASFNILWSNTETLKPALYSRTPKPVVERRWKTKDPVARLAGQTLERATSYQLQCMESFDDVMRDSRDDYLLTGRGASWVRIVPKFETDDTGVEQLIGQEVQLDYVYRKDFLYNPARRWREVTWVARKNYLTHEEMEAQFQGARLDDIQFTHTPAGLDEVLTKEQQAGFKKAIVFEIWDKTTKDVLFISPGYDDCLRVAHDPLRLKGFFPAVKPLFATSTTDTLEPVPSYVIYQDLAKELDTITAKINLLTDAVRVTGLCDGSLPEIMQLMHSGSEFKIIQVKDWARFSQAGGLEGSTDWFPLDHIAKTLSALYEARDATKASIFEISGMSDIVRGQSNPNETATAQQIKGQFATLRLSDWQAEMQRFARDNIALIAEIIAEHFEPEMIAAIVGEDLSQDPAFGAALQMLQQDALRTYKIDIETDSTIAVDEQVDKESRNEFMGAFQQLFSAYNEAVANGTPEIGQLMGEVMLFGLRGYKAGRSIEAAVETMMEQANQRAQQQAQQPPQPDPAMMEMQAKMQLEQQKMQMEGQKGQFQMQLEQAKMQMQREIEAQKLALEQARIASDADVQKQKLMVDWQKMQQEASLKLQELEATAILEAEKAKKSLELEAFKFSNTPQNKETTETVKGATEDMRPIIINTGSAKKKKVTMTTDPMTGARMGMVEEVEDAE